MTEHNTRPVWELRAATEADAATIAALEQQLFPQDPWSLEMVHAELTHPTRSYWVAQSGDEIIGYAGVMVVGHTADIQNIAVVANWQGAGVGSALLSTLHSEAQRRGARQALLEVRVDNHRAQALYRRFGYTDIAVRPHYYPGGQDALVMSRDFFFTAQPSTTDLTPRSTGVPSPPVVLGIETSCDETGVGIVCGNRVLANVVRSSMNEHARFGGVIPEIASRAHVEAIMPTLHEALATAGLTLDQVDAIAVTAGPGLAGALMVGVCAAKALALAAGKPLYGVNHLVAHVCVGLLERDDVGGVQESLATDIADGTVGALLVSGGHTEIVKVCDITQEVELLGATLDDAAGEAYDKVARLLGLGYPGGPAIDQAAAGGDPHAVQFPRGLSNAKYMGSAQNPGTHRYDFSFSGLKTAVARVVEAYEASDQPVPVADIAASFQESVVDVLTHKAVLAATENGVKTLLLGGGVAANSQLRDVLAQRCAQAGVQLVVPPLALCTDNGAMVAALGAQLVAANVPASSLGFAANPGLPITAVSVNI